MKAIRAMNKKITIHDQLKKVLTERAAALPEGAKFSTEYELCAEFKVSRMTVNKVINELTAEGHLLRLRPKGTFVRHIDTPRQVITYFLPSAGFISENNASANVHRRYLNGVFSAAQEYSAFIETSVLQVSTYRGYIDPQLVSHLDSNSKVFMSTTMARTVFKDIAASKAKVVIAERQEDFLEEEREAMRNWQIFTIDRYHALLHAIEYLYKTGARRIALVAGYLFIRNHPYKRAYRDAMESFGLPEQILDVSDNADAAAIFSRFVKTHEFDALLFDPMIFYHVPLNTFSEAFSIPERVRLFALSDPNMSLNPKISIPYIQMPLEQIGYDAIRFLLGKEPDHKKPVIYKPKLIIQS